MATDFKERSSCLDPARLVVQCSPESLSRGVQLTGTARMYSSAGCDCAHAQAQHAPTLPGRTSAWVHAGGLPKASAFTETLYTDLPHQSLGLKLEEDTPIGQSPVTSFCSVAGVMIGEAGKSMDCDVERWKAQKYNFFWALLAFPPVLSPSSSGRTEVCSRHHDLTLNRAGLSTFRKILWGKT